MVKTRKPSIYQEIFNRHLAHKIGNVPQNYWAGEMKVAKELLLLKDIEFWRRVEPPGDKINSLNWFRTDYGRRYIEQEEKRIKSDDCKKELVEKLSQKKVESSKEIPVEDFGITETPKNPLEFLIYG